MSTDARKRPRDESCLPGTFDPTTLGLEADFVLTDYTRLKGCSCKIPQPQLLHLLNAIGTTPGLTSDCAECDTKPSVGMDCSIVPLRHSAVARRSAQPLYLVSTTDFFFPSVDDPYLQGQVGCANVLSDLFAMGIPDCDTMLMLLAASTDMAESERYTVTTEIMRGFADTAAEAQTSVTGGQSVLNPWPLIGGVAMSVASEAEMLRPEVGLAAGQILVLTKPLGAQLAVNVWQWQKRPSPLSERCLKDHFTEEEARELFSNAASAMATLNQLACRLMMKHGAKACTDITGFGILGHARNLALSQLSRDVRIVLDRLPVFRGAVKAERLLGDRYKLFQGLSAETSGGLLIAFPNLSAATTFQEALAASVSELSRPPRSRHHGQSWIVGRVEPCGAEGIDSNSAAVLDTTLQVLEV